jgi:hypothetical protein
MAGVNTGNSTVDNILKFITNNIRPVEAESAKGGEPNPYSLPTSAEISANLGVPPASAQSPAEPYQGIAGTGKDINELMRKDRGKIGGVDVPAITGGADNQGAPQGDIYARVRELTDKEFKEFADDKTHGLPGIGYVGDAKPEFDAKGNYVGKGKFIRMAENPDEKPVAPLTREQFNDQTARIHALGVGAAAREQHQEANRIKEEQVELNRQKDWETRYGQLNPETGKTELNAPLAVAKTVTEGGKVPAAYKGLEEQLSKAYKTHSEEWEIKFGKAFPNSKLTKIQRKSVSDNDFLKGLVAPQGK